MSTPEAPITAPTTSLTPRTRKLLTAASAVLAALSLTLAIAISVAAFYQDKVLPQTFLAGISLGGRSSTETQETIRAVTEAISTAPITVHLDDSSSQITPSDLGLAVTSDKVTSDIKTTTDIWAALTPSYWQSFFNAKYLALDYNLDEQKFKTSLAEKLTSSEIAVDAEIIVENGELKVTEAKIGRSINLDEVRSTITSYLAGKSPPTITLSYQPTEPQISTAEATRVKTEIEAAVRPIQLTGDDKKFTISKADQFGLISYQKNGASLTWSFDSNKLSGYLDQKINSKIEIKMVERVIQSQPEIVLTEGRDGRRVDTAVLAKAVTDALNGKIDTAATPIAIPLVAVKFTDRWVDPLYRTDRFDGLYLEVNIKVQRVYVIQDHVKVNEWLISSGKPGTPTPEGQYYIINKIELAQSRLFPGIWMQKWNALTTTPGSYSGYDGYGLHRVPCFNKECTVREPQSHLGHPASHGCVRVADEGADWIYANAPIGTPVNIHR